MDTPLIYCNGDSYSSDKIYDLQEATYDYVVGKSLNGYVINHAIPGSCNRRIIRVSVADLIHQRQLNKTQRIIALIGLSFELRSEVWNNDMFLVSDDNRDSNIESTFESDFKSYQFSNKPDWLEQLKSGNSVHSHDTESLASPKFFDMLTKGNAFFYSPYAERINLYCDLIMFKSLMDQLNIEFLIFNSPPQETDMSADMLLDHFASEIYNDNRFIMFKEGFSLCSYLNDNGFEPFDFKDNPSIGHYKDDGHRYFAENILIPRL